MLRKTAFVALAVALALCGPAVAAETDSVILTVTVTSDVLSVDVTEETVALGTMLVGHDKVSSVVNVQNTGTVLEDFGLRIATVAPPGLTPGTTAGDTGADRFVLQAAFVANGDPAPTTWAAGADWVVLGGVDPKWSDAAAFGPAGWGVPAGGEQDLYFLFDAPTSLTTPHENIEHSITVEVSCKEH